MNLKQVLNVAVVAILATSQSYSGAISSLGQLLFSDGGVKEIMMKRGMKATSIPKQQSTLKNAYKALGLKSSPTVEEVTKKLLLIKKNDPSEAKTIDSVLANLNKSSDDVSGDLLRDTMNSIVRISMRKGGLGTSLTECSKCNDELVQIVEQENKYIQKIMKQLPKSDASFARHLKIRMRDLGGVPKTSVLRVDDKRMLAVFTHLNKRGSRSQKKFSKSLREFSKDDAGKINLFSSNLWKLPSQGASDRLLDNMTNVMALAAKEKKSKGVTHEDAFYSVLVKMAGDDEEMLDEAASIKANNCFFGK